MATNSNNITIKLKVDGSEDAVKAVNNVKASVDQITKAQADLIKQKAKEIELDGALRRSLEARGKILKEDMQKARIDEYKSMQEILRSEKLLTSEIKRRAGEIANTKRASEAEVSAKRNTLRLESEIKKAESDRALTSIRILKEQENLKAASHRAELARIKAESRAANQQSASGYGQGRTRRELFFTPVIRAASGPLGIQEGAVQSISKFADVMGRTTLLFTVLKNVIGQIIAFDQAVIQLAISAEKFNLKMKSLEIVTRNASLSFGQATSIFQQFNDGLQSQDAILTATRTFSTLGISASQTRELISGLRDGIVAMGGDVSEQLPLMALAFKRQESALLDNAGITANLDVMYKEYAKTIGTSTDKLTTQQKVQASVVGSLKELRMYQGLAAEQTKGITGANAKMNMTYEAMSRNFAEGATFLADWAIIGMELTNVVLYPLSGAWKAVGQAIGAITAPIRDASVAMVGLMEKLDPSKFKYGFYNREQSVASMTSDTSMSYRRMLEGGVKPAGQLSSLSNEEVDKTIGSGFLKEIQEKRQRSLDSYADALGKQNKKLANGAKASRSNLLQLAEEDTKVRANVVRIYSESEQEFTSTTEKALSGQAVGASQRSYKPFSTEDTEKIRENQRVLHQDLIDAQNRFDVSDIANSKQTQEEKIKNQKSLFESQLRNQFKELQLQKNIGSIDTVKTRILGLIANQNSSIIDQYQRQAMLADVELKVRERLLSVANKSTKDQYDQIKISSLKSKIAGKSANEEKQIADEMKLLVADRSAIESRIAELRMAGRTDLANELESSSGYISILERIVKLMADKVQLQTEAERIAKREMDERVKSFKEEKQGKLDRMSKAHGKMLVDRPEVEVDAYRQMIANLEKERTQLETDAYAKPIVTEEDMQKYDVLTKVIEEAQDKLDESIKKSFEKTMDIIGSGLDKAFSFIQTGMSGDFGSSFGVVMEDVLSNVKKEITTQLSLDESLRKSIAKSKDAIGTALSPIVDKISTDIAKPIVNGINAGLENPAIAQAITGLGVTAAAAVGGIMIMWELLGKNIYNYFENVRNFAIETQAATKTSISGFGREFSSKRRGLYGLKTGGIGSSELEENLKKQEDERKKMNKASQEIKKNNSSIAEFIMSGMGMGTVQSGLNYLESHQKLSQLENQYKEVQDAADKYNDQLNREEALKSSKEMLYDLDQQIAEMNIDNALKMGQITQEEADRQKKLLEISQKKKELTDQAVDIAAGFVDQNILRKYKDNPAQLQADLATAVRDFQADPKNTAGLEALGITGEEITGPGGLAKVFEKIGKVLSGMTTGANMPGSSPDKPMYTQVVNVKDFRLAFPDSAYFRAPAIATTTSSGVSLNANRTNMGL